MSGQRLRVSEGQAIRIRDSSSYSTIGSPYSKIEIRAAGRAPSAPPFPESLAMVEASLLFGQWKACSAEL